MGTTPPVARTCTVRIEYFSGNDPFAVETPHIEVADCDDVETASIAAAEASPYFNDRVPDLSYQIRILSFDPDEPEPPPADARAKLRRRGAD